MSRWASDELGRVGEVEELQNAVSRRDGTLRKPVTIWVVRVGDDLYIRSYRGPDGSWYRAALKSHKGQIRAGGVQKDVTLVEETDPEINERIDAAYRSKYGRYPQYVAPLVNNEGRATTLKLVPRAANA